MENKQIKGFKNRTINLFQKLTVNKKEISMVKHIKSKSKEIEDFYHNREKCCRKFSLTDNYEEGERSGTNLHKFFTNRLTKYTDSLCKNKKNMKNIPIKRKKHSQLYSKIHFGSFFNSFLFREETRNKYENFKSEISKSKNFSFINDPKTIRYKKLPLDLYLSKEDDKKIKDIIATRFMTPENRLNTDKNESLVRLSYDNGKFDNNLQNKIIEEKERRIFYRNKLNINNYISNNNDQISDNTFYKTNNVTQEEESNKSTERPIKIKYYIKKNLTDLNDNNTIIKKNIFSHYQDNYNKTEYNNFHLNRKNPFLLKLDNDIKYILRAKTPNNFIKNLAKYYKQKSEGKMKLIDKLKGGIKSGTKLLIDDLKTNNNRKKKVKKNITKHLYISFKKRERLLSFIEKLKNINKDAPMMVLKHLNDSYIKNSKEIININSNFRKKINKLFESCEKERIIRKKIDKKNDLIHKIILKNKIDIIKLKNKYKNLDLIIKEMK